jgi:hypothetical protein
MVAGVAATTAALMCEEEPAQARGRATLEFAYDKYTPRILAGGNFYKAQLKSMIAGNDFAGIKLALAEPPNKRSVQLLSNLVGVTFDLQLLVQVSTSNLMSSLPLF